MLKINGKHFWEKPCYCGACPFYFGDGKTSDMRESSSGFCTQFERRKRYYDHIPKRCADIFKKAFTFPDGSELVIVFRSARSTPHP